jgi:hypothetical protein
VCRRCPFGKLTRQIGSNPTFLPLYPVTASPENFQEDMTYSGVGGRISAKTTVMGTGAVNNAVESWSYSTLGLVSSHNHPRQQIPFPAVSPASFLESVTYTYGRPTSVALSGKDYLGAAITGASIAATYRPAGNLATYAVTQTGGQTLTTTITADSSGLPRPSRISSSLGSFDTGAYTYDASGNVAEMRKDVNNKDVFNYDSQSRLTKAIYTVALVRQEPELHVRSLREPDRGHVDDVE